VNGMHTIDDSLLHLLTQGYISEDHAVAHSRDQDFIRSHHRKFLEENDPKRKKR
jgi:Tfp pilus assembly ATPase PilU